MAILPVFLVGGMFVLMGPELGFGERTLGFAVGGFYLCAALLSPHAGRVGDGLGARRALCLGVAISAVCLLGIAVSPSSVWMFAFLLLGGLGLALTQMAGNVLLVAATPAGRQAFAFAVKQSAVPFASLAGGASVPLVGLTLGWRWAFVLPVALLLLLAVPLPEAARVPARHRGSELDRAALVLLACGAALGSGAANAAAAFLVPFAVSVGLAPGRAGGLLAFGGAVGVTARLLAGWLGDRLSMDGLRVTAGLIASGVVGFVLFILTPSGMLLTLATIIIFGAGWGWSGIFTHAVARSYPQAAGRATGISQSGVFAGGTLGPAVFGVVVSAASYSVAWLVAVGFAVGGGFLVLVGRTRLAARRRVG